MALADGYQGTGAVYMVGRGIQGAEALDDAANIVEGGQRVANKDMGGLLQAGFGIAGRVGGRSKANVLDEAADAANAERKAAVQAMADADQGAKNVAETMKDADLSNGIPNATRLTQVEQETAKRFQVQERMKLDESPHKGAEYIDDAGHSYDQLGHPRASQFWNKDEFLDSIDSHLLKSNNFTIIDLTGFTPQQIEIVRKYIQSLSQELQDRILTVGFTKYF